MPVQDAAVAGPSTAAGTQFDGWDDKGTPIVTKKPEPTEPPKKIEEPAASPEPKGENAAEPGAAKPQEKDRKQGDKLSLEEEVGKLRRELRETRQKLDERERSREPEPKPASTEPKKPAEPASYAEWRKAFKPREWIEKWVKDNPTQSYEDAVSALADYQSDIRDKYRQIEQLQQQGRERAQTQLKKTLEKYPDAEPKIREAAKALNGAGLPYLTAFVDESEFMTDLLFTLSDPATLDNLLETARTKPGKALRVLRDMETSIEKALKTPDDKKPEAEAKKETTPAEPKPRAPKPPTEVGGRGTAPVDEEESAAKSNDFNRMSAAMTARYFSRK